MLKKKVYYFFHNFLFILSYVHHFPGQRNTFKRQGFRGAYFRSFSHDLRSPERDTTAHACRFSCFFCAAYGLLLTQTRTQCSNSASRAIAMLEKSAKISPNACAVVSLSDEHGHAENSYIFVNDATFAFGACGLSAHTAPIKMAIANHVEQPFAQNHHLPESKCMFVRLFRQTFGRFSLVQRIISL